MMRLSVLFIAVLSINLVCIGCGESTSTPVSSPSVTPAPTAIAETPIGSPTLPTTSLPAETDEEIDVQIAQFELDSLSIQPNSVTVGEVVEISASVTNIGGIEGTYTAVLTADGAPVESQELNIPAGSTHEVSFRYEPVSPGALKIGLGELTGELEIAEAVLSGPAEVSITRNETAVDFPDTIGFILEGSSVLPATQITLEFGTSKRSLVNEVSKVEPEYAPGSEIRANWVMQMKETLGSLPPGAEIWWRWRITDESDRVYVTERQTTVLTDSRFKWQSKTLKGMIFYWHNRESGFGDDLTSGVEDKLARIDMNVTIPEERPIEVFVYGSTDEMRDAVLFTQEWTGALAFTTYNIILIGIGPDQIEWGKETLAHEITHILVEEVVFGPFGDIPTWLNEGLAQYAEGDSTQKSAQSQVDTAIQNDSLLSLKSLGSSFPTAASQAYLAYAESASVVSYLIETYGWEKMRELLEAFKGGATYDNALKQVYSFDTNGLEDEWLEHIGEA